MEVVKADIGDAGLQRTSFVRSFASAAIAGGIAKSIVAPFERVSLLLMVQSYHPGAFPAGADLPYKGYWDALTRIPKEQGLSSLWRGNLTNAFRYAYSQALNFSFNSAYRALLHGQLDKQRDRWQYIGGSFAAGGAAGATALLLTYPIPGGSVRNLLNKDGFKGWYRGFWPTVQGAFVYRAVVFGLYDTIRGDGANLLTSLLLAQASVMAAGVVSYPWDIVRRRLLATERAASGPLYKNCWACWKAVASKEGVPTFFKGCVPNVSRSLGGAIVLVLYDRLQ